MASRKRARLTGVRRSPPTRARTCNIGPRHYVRHPTYAEGLLAAIGSAIVCVAAWIFLLSISVRFSSDERLQKISLIVKQFPNDYPITRNERSVDSVRMVVFLTDFLYKGRAILRKAQSLR